MEAKLLLGLASRNAQLNLVHSCLDQEINNGWNMFRRPSDEDWSAINGAYKVQSRTGSVRAVQSAPEHTRS